MEGSNCSHVVTKKWNISGWKEIDRNGEKGKVKGKGKRVAAEQEHPQGKTSEHLSSPRLDPGTCLLQTQLAPRGGAQLLLLSSCGGRGGNCHRETVPRHCHASNTWFTTDLHFIFPTFFHPLSIFTIHSPEKWSTGEEKEPPPPCFQETRSVMPIFSGNTQRGSSSSSEGIYLSIIRKQRLSRFVTVPKSFQCKGFIKFTKVCSRRSREKKFFFLSLLLDGWKQKRESTNN